MDGEVSAVATAGIEWFWYIAIFLLLGLFWLRRSRRRGVPRARSPRSSAVLAGASGARRSNVGRQGSLPSQPTQVEEPAVANADAELPDALDQFQLLRAADLSASAAARVSQLAKLLALPHPVLAAMAHGLDDDALVDAVLSDPRLSAEVLRTVNSAAFALQSPIESVPRAVTYLGLNYVKGLVSELALAPSISLRTPAQVAAARRVWNSSVVASAAAQVLATQLVLNAPSVAATQSVLGSLGDLCMISANAALAEAYVSGSTLVERVTAQQRAVGANAAIVGAALASHWQLPEGLRQSLQDSLLPLVTPPSLHPQTDVALQRAVLCYFAARLGDAVAFGGLRDVGQLEIDSPDAIDCFHIPSYLTVTHTVKLPQLLQDPAIRRKLNQLVSTLPTL